MIIYSNKTYDLFPLNIVRDRIVVRFVGTQQHITVVNLYAPPHPEQFTALEEIIPYIEKQQHLLICGDLNARHALWDPKISEERGNR